jgi:hypothetical protein
MKLPGVRAYIAGIHADLNRSIAAADGRTLVISGEDIGVIQATGLARMRELFMKRFDEVVIVGYVRPPGSFMASSFQQRSRRGVRLSVEQSYRNYQKSFGKFDDVFGRENVQLWKFDPRSFPDGCAVRDFCSRLGVALPRDRIVRLNESFSRQAVLALYTYYHTSRKAGTMKNWESQQIGWMLSGPGSTKFRFSPDVIEPVLEANREDIEWMEARLGQPLREELKREPGDIASESDLLRPDPEVVKSIRALLEKAGAPAPTGPVETPEQVATLVHALRETLKPQAGRPGPVGARVPEKGRRADMGLPKIIRDIREADPALLERIPPPKAEALVMNVFRHISSNLAEAEEGVVQYPGLGRFQIRKAGPGPRIQFHRAGPDDDSQADDADD